MKTRVPNAMVFVLFLFACHYHRSDGANVPDEDTGKGNSRIYPLEPEGGSNYPIGQDTGSDAAICTMDNGLIIETLKEPPPGVSFPVLVRTRDRSALSGSVTLSANDREISTLTLYRGRGSKSLVFDRVGVVQLKALMDDLRGCKTLDIVEKTVSHISGELNEDSLRWTADTDIWISADMKVSAGNSLTIESGTRVFLAEQVNITINGTLKVQGTANDPVLFAPIESAAWGGIRILNGASAELNYTLITGGGGNSSFAFGHSSSQPVLYTEKADLAVKGGGVIDNPGKAFGSRDASVMMDDLTISRCDTGGEHERSEVRLEHSHILEIPDNDGLIADDDNDGIYLVGVRRVNEEIRPSKLIQNVFAVGEDDAIDHNGADVELDNNWIENFYHEGVAASSENRIVVRDTVITRCEQGIEAGYGMPEVTVENCLLFDNNVGLRFGDTYDRECDGKLIVTNTVVANSHEHNVWNYAVFLDGPKPDAIDISCSMVNTVEWDGINYNISGTAEWDEMGCVKIPKPGLEIQCVEQHLGPRICQ